MKAIAGGTHLSLLVLQRFVIPNHNVLRRNHRHRVTCPSFRPVIAANLFERLIAKTASRLAPHALNGNAHLRFGSIELQQTK
jgi:hypothetical protein